VFTIKRTDEFNAWLLGLKDSLTHRRLLARLRKASVGNLGDVKPVGAGVFEMREFFGPGWRMYYVQRGAVVIVMPIRHVPRGRAAASLPARWAARWRSSTWAPVAS
jgi:putative addiction module killer protein